MSKLTDHQANSFRVKRCPCTYKNRKSQFLDFYNVLNTFSIWKFYFEKEKAFSILFQDLLINLGKIQFYPLLINAPNICPNNTNRIYLISNY